MHVRLDLGGAYRIPFELVFQRESVTTALVGEEDIEGHPLSHRQFKLYDGPWRDGKSNFTPT